MSNKGSEVVSDNETLALIVKRNQVLEERDALKSKLAQAEQKVREWEKAFDEEKAAKQSALAGLQQKLRESEAGASELRIAFARMVEFEERGVSLQNTVTEWDEIIEQAHKSLSTSAGKSLLAELEQLREAKAALEWASENVLGC